MNINNGTRAISYNLDAILQQVQYDKQEKKIKRHDQKRNNVQDVEQKPVSSKRR